MSDIIDSVVEGGREERGRLGSQAINKVHRYNDMFAEAKEGGLSPPGSVISMIFIKWFSAAPTGAEPPPKTERNCKLNPVQTNTSSTPLHVGWSS